MTDFVNKGGCDPAAYHPFSRYPDCNIHYYVAVALGSGHDNLLLNFVRPQYPTHPKKPVG